MPLTVGDILLNRYRITALIAVGGFGAVYRAEDRNLMNKACAVKENLETKQAAQQAFLQEAKLLADLNHVNLPRVTDYFLEGQNQYLVMDLVEGEDLQDMVDRLGPMPEQHALYWIGQVIDALNYLHSQRPPIIHRDIKPANIKITRQGQAMLVDFGIAKTFSAGSRTQPGARGVSPGYSPVEQYGQGNTDQRTDIYALGATLYTLLTGQTPVESVQRSHGMPMTLIRQINPGVRPNVEAATLQAMELHPDHRFFSVLDFRTSLNDPLFVHTPGISPYQGATRQVAGGVTSPPGTATWPATAVVSKPIPVPGTKPWPGWLWPVIIASVILFCLVVGIVGLRAINNILNPTEVVVEDESGVLITQPSPTRRPSVTPGPTDTQTSLSPSDTPIPTRASISTLIIGDTQISPRDAAVMVAVPAGEFLMGLDASQLSDSDERPQHSVYLDDFWIDQYEVTNAQFEKFVNAEGVTTNLEKGILPFMWDLYKHVENTNDPARVLKKGINWRCPRGTTLGSCGYDDNEPVVWISWDEARRYCEWAGKRLPTEAEWEKAARGSDGRIYPWGEKVDNGARMNFADRSALNHPSGNRDIADSTIDDRYPERAPVGKYSEGKSPYGALDMAGNVWEWVADYYSSTFYTAQDTWKNPINNTTSKKHVLRGGSYYDDKFQTRVTNRYGEFSQDVTEVNVGFRCAMNAEGPGARFPDNRMPVVSSNPGINPEFFLPALLTAFVLMSPLVWQGKKRLYINQDRKKECL
jgi:serine/threonine-protein kinase